MSNEKITATIKNSSCITFGKVQSTADKVFDIDNVHGFHTEELYHFGKSAQEVDDILMSFENGVHALLTHNTVLQSQILSDLSVLKENYLKSDKNKLTQAYQNLTSTLSNHITIAGVFIPTFELCWKALIGC